jgi:hypothetical protein
VTRTEQLERLQAAYAAEARPAFRDLYEQALRLFSDLTMAEVCSYWLGNGGATTAEEIRALSYEELVERVQLSADRGRLSRRWRRFWFRFEAIEIRRAGRRELRMERRRKRWGWAP